jgi:hypothetical protein
MGLGIHPATGGSLEATRNEGLVSVQFAELTQRPDRHLETVIVLDGSNNVLVPPTESWRLRDG